MSAQTDRRAIVDAVRYLDAFRTMHSMRTHDGALCLGRLARRADRAYDRLTDAPHADRRADIRTLADATRTRTRGPQKEHTT